MLFMHPRSLSTEGITLGDTCHVTDPYIPRFDPFSQDSYTALDTLSSQATLRSRSSSDASDTSIAQNQVDRKEQEARAHS